MWDIGAVQPALIAKLLNGVRQQLLIHLKPKVDLTALDILLGEMLHLIPAVAQNGPSVGPSLLL